MKKASQPVFGITSMGEKGQVVIPADIRTALKLGKGDKLVVMAHEGGVGLIPAAHFSKMAEQFAAVLKLTKPKK